MKKAVALFSLLTVCIYRITIGQTPVPPTGYKLPNELTVGYKDVYCAGKPPAGFLGVMPSDGPAAEKGLTVDLVENGPAEAEGLPNPLTITALNGTPVNNWDDLEKEMATSHPGDRMVVDFVENGKTKARGVTLTRKLLVRSFYQCGDRSKKIRHETEPVYQKKPACLGVFGSTKPRPDGTGIEGLEGVKVTDLVLRGAAEKAGIANDDIITAIDGVPVENFEKLYKTIAEYQPGDRVKVSFVREEKRHSVEAVLKACDEKPVESVNKSKVFVVTWPDAKPAQGVEPQPFAPSAKLSLESFTAFPNPVEGEVTVRFTGEAVPTEVRLTSASGQVLFSENFDEFGGQYEQHLDLGGLPAGQVVFSVLQNGKVFSEAILVQ